MAELPGGDVAIGGAFGFGGERRGIARIRDAEPRPFGDATDGLVTDLAIARDGTLLVTGNFGRAGPNASAGFARIRSSCAAAATPFGGGCAGPGGTVTLTADRLPWIGNAWRATASGLSGSELLFELRGLQPLSLPLPVPLGTAAPGCQLFTTPDLVSLLLAATGDSMAIEVYVPPSLALIGRTIYQQVLPVDLGSGVTPITVAASNGLAFTLGTF